VKYLPIAATTVAILFICATSVPGSAPVMDAQTDLSHLVLHGNRVPESLLTPLADADSQLIKGLCIEDETALAKQLQATDIHQRLLRVAVADVEGIKVALVKLQAGDQLTGQLRLAALEADALATLEAAFSLGSDIRHVDVWSVVPSEANAGGQSHRPVFSVSTTRSAYYAASNSAWSGREGLHGLGVVRYDPTILNLAPDSPTRDSTLPPLPTRAYTEPSAGYGVAWQHTLSSNAAPHNDNSDDLPVHLMMHGTRTKPYVAITIDDGPCPMLTPLILEILARYRVTANFFVVGEKTEQYPQLLREIAEAGHLIGNHTYHHRRLSHLSAEQIGAELDACQTAVGRLTGQVMRYLRPPGGNYTAQVLRCASIRSQIVTLWTHNAADWANPPVDQIVQRCLSGIRPGSIILMHGGDINSARALPIIIRGLRARGLQPVSLSELHGSGCPLVLSPDRALHLSFSGWQPDQAK